MATRVPLSFFKAKEVLFIGFSRSEYGFSDMVRTTFMKSGAEVHPVNPNFGNHEAFPVYKSPEEAPGSPELAYVLTPKTVTAGIVESLAKRGVKRVLFQSKMSVDAPTLERCKALGMETALACPMMALGGGFHRFHGWLAGVRK